MVIYQQRRELRWWYPPLQLAVIDSRSLIEMVDSIYAFDDRIANGHNHKGIEPPSPWHQPVSLGSSIGLELVESGFC